MNVTVLGAGAWGTALAKTLQEGAHVVTLWGHDPAKLAAMQAKGRNEPCLPGIALPRDLIFVPDLASAVATADCLVVAVPSKAFREVTARLADYSGVVVSVTKGIEHDTGLTMCGVLGETIPGARRAALSGPSFARELALGIPTAMVAASPEMAVAEAVQRLFHRPFLRVYTGTDLRGVELGGALKNVIAIAAGVSDGLRFGDNSKAALITRAMAEIRRLGVAAGAQGDTFTGLSGLGDLTVTCFSRLSRNREFGERLGRGEKLADVIAGMTAVAEGYPTTRSAYLLARRLDVMTPVIDEVYHMLYEGKNLALGVRDLMMRESKPED